MALSEAAKDVVYYRKLIAGLSPSAVAGPTQLACDNKGARNLAYNPEHHDKSKHVARRHFYVRDLVEDLEVVVPYVPSADNIADFLTKPLNATSFLKLRARIMNERASLE